MSNYTKINIRKDIYKEIQFQATLNNRSAVNWLENFLLEHITLPLSHKADDMVRDLVTKRLADFI